MVLVETNEIGPEADSRPIENLTESWMFIEETATLYTPESRPSKSRAYLFLPMEFDVIESVDLILSLESKIVIDNLDDVGPTMFKIALELRSK